MIWADEQTKAFDFISKIWCIVLVYYFMARRQWQPNCTLFLHNLIIM